MSIDNSQPQGLGATIEAGFRQLLDNIAQLLFLSWMQPLMRFPRLRPLLRQSANIMSIGRMLVSPYVVAQLAIATMKGSTGTAIWWLVASAGLALLDGLDGPVARNLYLPKGAPNWPDMLGRPLDQARRNCVTDIGKGIDPLADKVYFISLLGAFWWLTWSYHGTVAGLVFTGTALWALKEELALVKLSLPTEHICQKLGQEVPGANHYGKKKFFAQLLAMAGAWSLAIWSIDNPACFMWAVGVITVMARPLATRSLGLHTEEYRQMMRDHVAKFQQPYQQPPFRHLLGSKLGMRFPTV